MPLRLNRYSAAIALGRLDVRGMSKRISQKRDTSNASDTSSGRSNEKIESLAELGLEQLAQLHPARGRLYRVPAIDRHISARICDKDIINAITSRSKGDNYYDESAILGDAKIILRRFCMNYYFEMSASEAAKRANELKKLSKILSSAIRAMAGLDRMPASLVSEAILGDKRESGRYRKAMARVLSAAVEFESKLNTSKIHKHITQKDNKFLDDSFVEPTSQERWNFLVCLILDDIGGHVTQCRKYLNKRASDYDKRGRSSLKMAGSQAAEEFISLFDRHAIGPIGRNWLRDLLNELVMPLLPDEVRQSKRSLFGGIARSQRETFVKEEPLEIEGGDEAWSSSEGH